MAATQEAIEAVWRLESTRLIAGLVRIVRDVGLAEDLAQDALVAALAAMADIRRTREPRRLADDDRQAPGSRSISRAATALTRSTPPWLASKGARCLRATSLGAVDHVEDDVLRLMFICCHPPLTPEAQSP